MARIPEAEIERLKTEVSLMRLVEAKGIELKAHGKDRIGRCPFHDDKTPSLVISPDSNLWHCLGACQVGGSVIDWVMKVEGVSFKLAVEMLRNETAVTATPIEHVAKKCTVPKLPSFLAADSDEQSLLQQVIGYYHDCLKQSPEALAYLDKRGLNNAELIDTFKLGFANRTIGYRLPHTNRVEGAVLRGKLQNIGIYRASGHEHLTGSLVVPVSDELGVISDVYGRKINDKLRDGTAYHLYLPGPHRGVWNVAGLHNSDEVILCEALIDAMTFWVNGYKNVTASYGIEGFTSHHLNAFKQHNIKRILIAYDRDEAGDKAAATLAQKLIAEGFECFRVLFPKGMDANEYALKVGPASKSLGVVLRKAEWLGKGVAPSLTVNQLAVTENKVTATTETKHDEEIVETPITTITPEPLSLVADVEQQRPSVELPPLPASPLPKIEAPAIDAEIKDGDVHIAFADRRYRVRGHDKNTAPEQLKINLLANNEAGMHVDNLDLYSAKARQAFIKQAGVELGVGEELIKADIGKVLLHLENLHDAKLKEITTPQKAAGPQLDDAEQAEALALLKAPDLLQRILDDFHRCGVVGEETNKLVGYLACVSRKLDKPLAVIIQSSSAAGKSSLMDAVLQMIPSEERVQYSAMTGQSLFYMGETNLKHKILAIAEEEGASRASYALKLLQSDGSLTMASTGKDPVTGNLITQEYRVEGPVMIFLTTTAIEIDEELLNRCVVLSVNESREQTRAIHAQQRARRTLAGLQARVERERIIRAHANAQRLLRSLVVINPYADQLTFLDSKTRTRRDHEKYLSLIDSIALLHQHQRPIKTLLHAGQSLEYVEVTLNDIAMANQLAHDVLGRSLDELPPQTRKLLQLIDEMVVERCTQRVMKVSDFRFSRKDVRDHSGWGDTQLKLHLHRLEEMEYLIAHRGTRGQAFVYELAWNGGGEEGDTFLPGLIDVKKLSYDEKKSGVNGEKSGLGRPQVGGMSARGRGDELQKNIEKNNLDSELLNESAENALLANKNNSASYRSTGTSFGRSVIAAKARE
jgi:DNA primase catalytic core